MKKIKDIKILIINPNSSEDMTNDIQRVAEVRRDASAVGDLVLGIDIIVDLSAVMRAVRGIGRRDRDRLHRP